MNIPKPKQRYIPIILLFIILLAHAWGILNQYQHQPFYNSDKGIGLFHSESAFQFRYFKKVAEGKGIPKFDKKAQWPEGLHPHKEFTLTQQLFDGTCFKIVHTFLKKISHHKFLASMVALISLIPLLCIYFGLKLFKMDRYTTLFFTAFYAFTYTVIARKYAYEFEYFALPFIFGSFVAYLYHIQSNRKYLFAIIGGICLMIALSSWHFTRFFLLLVIASEYIIFILMNDKDRIKFTTMIYSHLIAIIIAGTILPVMWHSKLLISIQSFSLIILLCITILNNRIDFNKQNKFLLALSGGLVTILIFSILPGKDYYGHVFTFFFAKLKNFLIKPEDPSQIPFEARLYWIEAFLNLGWSGIVYSFGFLLPALIIAIYGYIKNYLRHRDAIGLFIITMLCFSFLAAIIAQRMVVFTLFFSVLCLPFMLRIKSKQVFVKQNKEIKSDDETKEYMRSIWDAPKRLIIFLVLLFVLQTYEFFSNNKFIIGNITQYQEIEFDKKIVPRAKEKLEIIDWISKNTLENGVILSNFEFSPTILLYANRPVNLHSSLERKGIRNKIKNFIDCLYSDNEKDFYQLAKNMRSKYFINNVNNFVDFGNDSYRYFANRLDFDQNSNIYKFHFTPFLSKYFTLVFQNRYYQVFKIKDKDEIQDYYPPYFPIYDKSLFSSINKTTNTLEFDTDKVQKVILRINESRQLFEALNLSKIKGENRKAWQLAGKLMATTYPDHEVYYAMALLHLEAGMNKKALEYIQRARRLDPSNKTYSKLYEIIIKS